MCRPVYFFCVVSVLVATPAHPQTAEDIAKVDAALPTTASAKPAAPRKLLVFTRCKGFVHSSIPLGAHAVTSMGAKTGAYEAVVSDDVNLFNADSLAQFDAVCMLNTTGEVFEDEAHKNALLDFVTGGKGLVGIHAATDCCYEWGAYGKMIGGYFDGHPWGAGDTVTCTLDDPAHPINAAFRGRGFAIQDEIYQFRAPYSRDALRVLVSLDTSKTDMDKGGLNRADNDFAISWIRAFGSGRVFYCSLGHNESTYWNPVVLRHYLDGIQFALGDLSADTTPSAQLSSDQVSESRAAGDVLMMDGAFADLAAYTYGNSVESLDLIAEWTVAAFGDSDRRADIERRLLAVLAQPVSEETRQFVVKQLALIGTEVSIPALAKLLRDPNTAEIARYALERNPSTAAGDALRAAMTDVDSATLLGIVNSLGERRESPSLPLIAQLSRADDPILASAAVMAIGKIGGNDAEMVLKTLLSTTPRDQVENILTAYLAAAQRRINAGESEAAVLLYDELFKYPATPRARIAALIGLAHADGARAVAAILDALKSDDPHVHAGAADAARAIVDTTLLSPLVEALPSLAPSAQAPLIVVMAEKNLRSAVAPVTATLSSNDETVALAAAAALGRIGGPDTAPLLANIAATSSGDLQRVARESLALLSGSEVDNTIVASIEKAEPAVRRELVQALRERRAHHSVPALLRAAADADESVRAAAYNALAALAGSEHLPAVAELLAAEQNDGAREEGEKAAAAIAGRSPDTALCAAIVLGALPDVKQGIPAYCSILRVLGKINDPIALEALLNATRFHNSDVRVTAVRALAEWPTLAATEQLLAIAKDAGEAPVREAALRGYLRMLASPENTGDVFNQVAGAFVAARTPEERKLVLAGIAGLRHPKLIDLVSPLLSDAEVQAEAAAALETLKKTALAVSASHASESAGLAVDGDIATRWSTNNRQKKGQWFELDLGYSGVIRKITLDTTPSAGDYPRGYAVHVSNDRDNWGAAVATGTGTSPVTEIDAGGARGRYIRIEQLGETDGLWWSIHEVTLVIE